MKIFSLSLLLLTLVCTACLAGPETGEAAYYSNTLEGKRTASGESYDPKALTAAHRSLPFGTKLRVTNMKNLWQTTVTINDRIKSGDHVLFLSKAAAEELGMILDGRAQVHFDVAKEEPKKAASHVHSHGDHTHSHEPDEDHKFIGPDGHETFAKTKPPVKDPVAKPQVAHRIQFGAFSELNGAKDVAD
ncbi:MAG: septal ring lytic transglycosylase RlpA family protein, partial [Verrucomicrobiota bacterium]